MIQTVLGEFVKKTMYVMSVNFIDDWNSHVDY